LEYAGRALSVTIGVGGSRGKRGKRGHMGANKLLPKRVFRT